MALEAIIVGAVIAWIAQVSKKRWVDQKYLVTALSLIAWVIWYCLTPYSQELVVQARTSIAWSAAIVYNVLKMAMEWYKSFSK